MQPSVRRTLTICSESPYLAKQEDTVAAENMATEVLCGWRCIRPRARYVCTQPAQHQRHHQQSSTAIPAQGGACEAPFPYMNGTMDETFSYFYKSRPVQSSQTPQTWRHQSINLEPVRTVANAETSQDICRDLADILASQVHQDILDEQARVASKLKAVGDSSSFSLGLEGIGLSKLTGLSSGTGDSPSVKSIHKAKAKHKKTKRPLGWFPLVNTPSLERHAVLAVRSERRLVNGLVCRTKMARK